jgi:hypothetical protein
MYFSNNSTILPINWVVFDGFLELVFIFKKSCFFGNANCSAVSNQVYPEIVIVIETLNADPTAYSFLKSTQTSRITGGASASLLWNQGKT